MKFLLFSFSHEKVKLKMSLTCDISLSFNEEHIFIIFLNKFPFNSKAICAAAELLVVSDSF